MKINVEIKVFIHRRSPVLDPSFQIGNSPVANNHTNLVKFIVEDKTISVSSDMICQHSPVLNEMIKLAEGRDIPLEGVKATLFQTVLKTIYYSWCQPIQSSDIPELLDIAYKFNIRIILARISEILSKIRSNKFKLIRRVELAYKYNLEALKIHLLGEYISLAKIKVLLKNHPTLHPDFREILQHRISDTLTRQQINGRKVDAPKLKKRKRKHEPSAEELKKKRKIILEPSAEE